MTATSLDLSQIRTDAISSAATFRTLIGLGTLATQSPTGTPSASNFLRGDYSWQTIDLSNYLPLSGGTLTGLLTTPRITLSGNVSAAAWTTTGIGIGHVARTITDTSSSGTVATAYTNVVGGNTIAASSSTTFTDYASLQVGQPTAGTNVTFTNRWAVDLGGAIRSSGYSLTGSQAQSLVDLSGTWNTTGTPTLIKATITDTASNANARLLSLEQTTLNAVGDYYRFLVTKSGSFISTGNATIGLNLASGASVNVGNGFYVVGGGTGLSCHASIVNLLTSNNISLCQDASAILAQRSGTTAQTFRIYNTYTDASNYERLALSSATYSSAKYQTIAAESAGTGAANINMVVSPKGTGAFMLQTPDGTATGGNARGTNAIDLQTLRVINGATAVASGAGAVAIGQENIASGTNSTSLGWYNRSTGLHGIAIGYGCIASGASSSFAANRESTASGQYSQAIGTGAVASSQYSSAIGGQCTASASRGVAFGVYSLSDRYGVMAYACDRFAATGDSQIITAVLRIKTTDATATTLMLDGSATRLTIPSGKVFAFVAKISGIKSDGSAVAFYTRKGCVKNVGGTTSLVGSIETIGTDTEDNASTDVAITADDTNDALQINVTGIAAETWRWVAVVEGVEIGYGT